MGQQSYCQAMPEQQYFIKRWALPIGIILLLGKYAQPTDHKVIVRQCLTYASQRRHYTAKD